MHVLFRKHSSHINTMQFFIQKDNKTRTETLVAPVQNTTNIINR
ncbi:hypothetical protein FUAX_13090 [Fulvitalea axinellae]|uniref:Uncharacterized protein n=1 Tax=Fulvitalea axinellae TaxID=1182444 RepID=A0AAU9CLR8_9BACT|nr:hypothetical protein FUAX_13090 [Fulvitalea axinellae]